MADQYAKMTPHKRREMTKELLMELLEHEESFYLAVVSAGGGTLHMARQEPDLSVFQVTDDNFFYADTDERYCYAGLTPLQAVVKLTELAQKYRSTTD